MNQNISTFQNLDQQENIHPNKTPCLIVESFNLAGKNIAKIFQIFLIFFLFEAAFNLINHYVFYSENLAFFDNNFKNNPDFYKSNSSFIYIVFYTLHSILFYLFSLILIFSIAKNCSILAAIKNIFKKFSPLFISTAIVYFAIFNIVIFSFRGLFGINIFINNPLFTIYIKYIISSFDLLAFDFDLPLSFGMSPTRILASIIFLTALVIFTRLFLFQIINICEEKYYFNAIARSFAYSKENALKIFFRSLFILIILLIIYASIYMILYSITRFIPQVGNDITLNHIDGLAGFIPLQIFTIYSYLTYKNYHRDLPIDFKSGKKLVISFIVILLIPLYTIIQILSAVLNLLYHLH